MNCLIKKSVSLSLVLCMFIVFSACSKEEEKEKKIVFQTLSYETLQSEAYSSIAPLKYEYITEESITKKQGTRIEDSGKAHSDGYWWIASKATKGTPGKSSSVYLYTYDIDGNQLSRVCLPDTTEIIEAEDIIYRYYGYIEAGSIFYPSSFTKFGSNCGGCHANADGYSTLSSGIGVGLHSVRQADGSWEDGITFEGYYMIAMNPPMPICTLVEVSNHSFEGEGLEPGVPFRAIVADRGVKENHVDLFVGDEHNLGNVVKTKKRNKIKVTVISLGRKIKRNGQTYCDF